MLYWCLKTPANSRISLESHRPNIDETTNPPVILRKLFNCFPPA